MKGNVIPVDLAATGGLLPMGSASPDQVNALLAGKAVPQPPADAPTEPVTDKEAAPAPEAKHTPTVCRHCSMSSDVDPAEPTEADIYAFSQSVWRDERFSKTYELFGKSLEVTFQTLTFDEEQAVEAAVDRERKDGKIPQDAFAMLMRLGELRLPLAVAKLRVGGYIMDRKPPENPFEYDLATEFTLIRKGPLKNVAVANVVGQQFRAFSRLAETLTNKALDRSFWQAAARVGS